MFNEMKLGEKYKDEFLAIDKNESLHAIMYKIIVKEKIYERDCVKWSIEEVEGFLKSLNSISPNSLSRALGFFRGYVKFICEKEKLPVYKFKLEHGRLYDLVDYDILLKTVISPIEYKAIVKQLINARDKVIFHLAWIGLTADEIKNLKESDIEFKTARDSGMKMALIKISNTKMFKTQDPLTVQDIEECMYGSKKYYVDGGLTKKGAIRKKYYDIQDTEYLIKPLLVGRNSKKDTINNPSAALSQGMKAQNVSFPGINTLGLTVADIKRSKLIYLLAPINQKFFNKEDIKKVFGTENDASLFWYKKIAQIKYATREEGMLQCLSES